MKIATGKPRARKLLRNVRAVNRTPSPDHDLPVLAGQEMSERRFDWEALMRDGVQPALLIGGERRWHRRR